MLKQPNLLILGASGGVANAFLHHFGSYRHLFGKLILLDKNKKILKDIFVDHKLLNYSFICLELKLPEMGQYYKKILTQHKINIVLDITDMDSLPIIEATNQAGVSYVNTALNDAKKNIVELFSIISRSRNQWNLAPHILSTGMNPGNVNMWVRYGIEKFGIPRQIIHFEYDTSKIAKKWHPAVTWSINEFLAEAVRDSTALALGRGRTKKLLPNALEHRQNMQAILQPIMKCQRYPDGFIVIHDENVSIADKYDIPSKFIYAINPQTMETLIKLYKTGRKITKKSLELADNIHEILDGADNIGVILDYHDQRVYYFNSVSNTAVIGTNATYTQVIIGIFSALLTLLFDQLDPKIHFVEDLYDTYFKHFMFDNLRVQEFVFKKKDRHLKLSSYNPMIRIKKSSKYQHLYIS